MQPRNHPYNIYLQHPALEEIYSATKSFTAVTVQMFMLSVIQTIYNKLSQALCRHDIQTNSID